MEMKRDLVVKRIIDAPVEKVWQAWTDPEKVKRWWGPSDYVSPSCKIDLKEGGKFAFCMRAPEWQGGQDSYTGGTYSKIVPMELLEFTQGITDEDGNPIDATKAGLPPDFPKEIRTKVEFHALKDNMTELVITEFDWPMSQMRVFSELGLHQTVDKLIESVR